MHWVLVMSHPEVEPASETPGPERRLGETAPPAQVS